MVCWSSWTKTGQVGDVGVGLETSVDVGCVGESEWLWVCADSWFMAGGFVVRYMVNPLSFKRHWRVLQITCGPVWMSVSAAMHLHT